jgi:hypothetical protein
MKYSITEKTLRRTTCRKDFHCLSGNMEGVCEVFDSDGTEAFVTDCPKREREYDHCKPFDGPQGFCECPTRQELYHRYGI